MTGEEIIDRHRQARKSIETRIKQKAIEVYSTFDKQERTLVQFGMFPAEKTQKADAELLGEAIEQDWQGFDPRDLSRLLAVGIMDAANAGPDKMVV